MSSQQRTAMAPELVRATEDWLERMKDSHDPADRAEFLAWLQQSSSHMHEFLCASTFDDMLVYALDPGRKVDVDELLRTATNVVPLSPDTHHHPEVVLQNSTRPDSTNQGVLSWRSAIAAVIGAAVAAAASVAIYWSPLIDEPRAQEQFGTTVGEQRSIGLTDGSIVHMNTQSLVRVGFSKTARDVYLLEGQALFKVKHDARPFRVHVDSTVVQALGTQFDVRRLATGTNIAVIEGVVQVTPDATEGIKVPAGESVAIAPNGKLVSHAPIAPEDVSAWQQRRLIFRSNTLADIALEFNRYNLAPKIRVEGEASQALRFSGTFDANDPESLLLVLAADRRLAVDTANDEIVIRSASFRQ